MRLLLCCFALFAVSFAGFTPKGKSMMLDGHNDFRSTIAKGQLSAHGVKQPAAADMIKLHWRDDIASGAQSYADTCPYDSSSVENAGENMFMTWTSDSTDNLDRFALDAMSSWKNELDEFGLPSLVFDGTVSSSVGDATQMAWSSTVFLGCGVTDCGPDSDRFDQDHRVVVICRYARRGNIPDEPIYEAGVACTNCPDFYSCNKKTGLCYSEQD